MIKMYEGFSATAYVDPASGGLPITIGYGSTTTASGGVWHLGDTITEADAEQLLAQQLQADYLPQLQKIPVWGSLNSNQQSALIDFSYNLGAYWYGSSSFTTITNVVKNQQWSKIKAAFELYSNPGSSVHAGLLARRDAEATLFLTPTTAGLMSESIAQVSLTASDFVTQGPPSNVAVGVGVAIAVILVAFVVGVIAWFCVSKRQPKGSNINVENTAYSSSYTCAHCSTNFFSADELAKHVESAHN